MSTRLRKYAMLHSLELPKILKPGRLFEDEERDVCEIKKSAHSSQPTFLLQQHGAANRLKTLGQHRSYKGHQNVKPPFRQTYDTT